MSLGSSWSSSDILRVALEGGKIIGFVEITADTRLSDARKKICEEIDCESDVAASRFRFLLPDAVPISKKQEAQIHAREFLPVARVRLDSSKESRLVKCAMPKAMNSVVQSTPMGERFLSNKVTVVFSGEKYATWITPDFTLAQLRREAARYWNLPAEAVLLVDKDQCSLPESSIVNMVVDSGVVNGDEILLMQKPHGEYTNGRSTGGQQNGAYFPRPSSPNTGGITINNLVHAGVVSPVNNYGSARAPPEPNSAAGNVNSNATYKARSSGLRVDTGLGSHRGGDDDDAEFPRIGDSQFGVGRTTKDPAREVHGSLKNQENGRAHLPPGVDQSSPPVLGNHKVSQERRHARKPQQLKRPKPADGVRVSHRPIPKPLGPADAVIDRYAQLWRVYTFYCVQLDPLRPFTMDRRGLLALFTDCQLIDDKNLTPQALNLIYASSCREGKQTNKMEFDDFLDVLVEVSRRTRGQSAGQKPSDRSRQAIISDFAHLLVHRILPLATTWDVSKWREHTGMISSNRELIEVLQPFAKPLDEIFRFYSPSVSSNKMDVTNDVCCFFHTFSAIALDFQVSGIGIRTFQLAEVYLSAVLSPGISYTRNQKGVITLHSSLNREGFQSTHLFPTGEAVWDRPVLFFGEFLSALIRLAFYAFPMQQNPVVALKALLQHFTKRLRRSYVMQILEKRRNMSTYPTGLMDGSNAIYRAFTKLWVAEGKPDYMALDRTNDGALKISPATCKGTIYCPESPRRVKRYYSKPDSVNLKNSTFGIGRQTLHELLEAEKQGTHEASKSTIATLLGEGDPDRGTSHVEHSDYTHFTAEGDVLSKIRPKHKNKSRHHARDGDERRSESQSRRQAPCSVDGISEGEESEESVYSEIEEKSSLEDSSEVVGKDPSDLVLASDSNKQGDENEPISGPGAHLSKRLDAETYHLLRKGAVFLKYGRRGSLIADSFGAMSARRTCYGLPWVNFPDPNLRGCPRQGQGKSHWQSCTGSRLATPQLYFAEVLRAARAGIFLVAFTATQGQAKLLMRNPCAFRWYARTEHWTWRPKALEWQESGFRRLRMFSTSSAPRTTSPINCSGIETLPSSASTVKGTLIAFVKSRS